jgi:hypothetical protein
MAGITKEQKALLHVAKAQLGLEDDIYRGILHQEAGVSSSKDLTLIGFDRVMKRLKQLGFRRKAKPVIKQRRPGMASPEQIWKINDLARQLGWQDNPKRLAGFVKKYANIERLEWLPHGKAWRIIEALKKLVERQNSSDGGKEHLAK